MKKLLSLVLASLMLVAVLAGCGSKAPEESQSPSQEPIATSPVSGAPQTTEEYQTMLGEFIAAFDGIVNGKFASLVGAVEAGNPEDFAAWANEYSAVEAELLAAWDTLTLASTSGIANESNENAERNIEINMASANVLNTLASFQEAVDRASEGDMSAFEADREAFASEAKAAIDEWNAIK